MKVSFNLKDASAEVSAIRLIVTHRGKVYRKYTGLSVPRRQWKKFKSGQTSTSPAVAEKLKRIRLAIESRLDGNSTQEEVLCAIDETLSRHSAYYTPIRKTGTPSFWDYFTEWADRENPARRQRRSTRKLIGELMGCGQNWNEVNSAYYFRLVERMNARGLSRNYQGAVIAKLKTVMSEGFNLGYHTSADYRRFKKTVEQPDTVYLTEEEVGRLWSLDLEDGMERRVRDLFIVGVYTAARFSDYSRLTADNIRGGTIVFTQRKTAESVVVPLSPKVAEVIRRNGGSVPQVNQVVFNRVIKRVCEKAGICGMVQVTRSRGERHLTTTAPKWSLVSSHTARRTGATLLYKSGVSTRQCMLITGHKSESAFRSYIRLTKEENADMLADNPFFK